MNWIEEVRKSLERLRDQVFAITRLYNAELGYAIGRENVSSLESAVGQADKALAAIPDEREMMKLLRWLDENYQGNRVEWDGQVEGAGTWAQRERCRARDDLYKWIVEYVEREFDCKLPEEGDSGKEDESSPQG